MAMERYAIYDMHEGSRRLYVDRFYDRRERAQADLDDLLRPYPIGHEWRRRLCVLPTNPASDPPIQSEDKADPARGDGETVSQSKQRDE